MLQPTEIENDRIRKIHVTKLSEEELEQILAEENETDEIIEDDE
jgi:hemolysin